MEDRPSKRRKTASPVRNVFPSYQSPTKASLSRFNPALLPPPSRARASLSSPLKSPSPRRPSAAAEGALRFVLGDKARRSAGAVTEASAGATAEDKQEENAPQSDDEAAHQNNEEAAHWSDGQTEPEPQVTPHGRAKVARPSPGSSESDDLPQTPQKLLDDPKFQDTPPRGILYNSTPRRRGQTEPSLPDLTLDSVQQEALDVGGDTELDAPHAEAPKRDPVPDQRQILELEKKQGELYQLQKELADLKADVSDLEHHIGLVGSTPDDSQYPDVNGLVSIINRSDPLNQSKQQAEQSTAALLASFLPFSIPIAEPESPDAEPESPDAEPTASYTTINTPALLALHTPLTITTTTHPPSPSTPTTQSHTIRLSSPHALLTATLELTTTTTAPSPATAAAADDGPTIARLRLAHLSPWARAEMGPWLAARAAARDLPAAGYACGRYWAVARRRAACWERVLRRWGRLAPGTDGTAGAEMSSGKGPRAGEGGADVDVLACAAHLGRRSLVLRGGAVALRFEWAVGLDWAGDATSSVRASATFPSAWHDADEREALRQAPQAFDLLVKKYGVFNAINTMARLVFSAET